MKKTLLSVTLLLTFTLCGNIGVYAQTQKGTDIDGEAADDYSGISVSMPDANTVAIGAFGNDDNGSYAGHVRIYTWNGSAWIQQGTDIDGEAINDQSGYSVSMPDANTVAIGALLNDGNGTNAGHVRIYSWNGSAWIQQGADIDGEAINDYFGFSVSMPDANTVAIGAYRNDGNGINAGHVRIYSWNGSAWIQQGADIDGEATGDQSGFSVSMPDANTVAIGAFGNAGNGIDAGHVRIYSWNGSAWVQQGTDIDGEAAEDNSGYSVNMPDANTVAIGAFGNDDNGAFAGHVRVYNQITTGISVVSALAEIGLFPNPTTGLIYFQEQSNVKLTNITGQVIFDQTNVNSLNISNQPSGIYFITFIDNDGQVIQRSKIIKE